MQSAIVQAAQFLQQGQHAQVEYILEQLQSDGSCQAFETALQALRQGTGEAQSQFTHFVALKLLRFCLVRDQAQWQGEKAQTVQFLLDYAYSLGDAVLSGSWKPVVAEWATAFAVVLKLGCTSHGASLDAVHDVVNGVSSLVSSSTTEVASRRLLARIAAQRTVEEFGLFDRSSRYRGLSIPVHCLCRERFESANQLSSVACQVFVSLAQSDTAQETQGTLEAGVGALLACLSWSGHRFFEEETSADENCDMFVVNDPQWDALLMGGVAVNNNVSGSSSSSPPPVSARMLTLAALIGQWWQQAASPAATYHGKCVAVPRQLVAEVLQQACSFKGEHWTPSQQSQYFYQYLNLALDCLASALSLPAEDAATHCLPSLVAAVSRLVGSREEMMLSDVAAPLVDRLGAATTALMALEAQSDEDEFVMAGLDELLSTWYHLCGAVQRCASVGQPVASSSGQDNRPSARALQCVTRSCSLLFQTYVQGKLATQGETEDDTNAFVEAFSSSHLHFVAHLGRVDAITGSRLLSSALQCLNGRLADKSRSLDYCEQLWCILTIVGFFVADPSEGEAPTIPLCFVQSVDALQAVCELLNTTVACSGIYTSALPSPAVFTAYVEVMRKFVRVYVDPEEVSSAFESVFGGVRTELVSFAMQLSVETLRRFSLDEDVSASVCALLDAVAGHRGDVHDLVRTLPAYETLTQFSRYPTQYPLGGCTRGRLIAFLLMCAPSSASFQDVAPLLGLFDVPTVRVEDALELIFALSGVFQSLCRQDILCALFPFFSSLTQRLLEVAYANFFERQIAIETVKLVRLIFTTSTPLVEDARVRELLSMVLMTFRTSVASLRTVPAWHTAEAEVDRVELLVALANLITSAAQWMKWDCYFPESETSPFASGSVECLAALFDFLNERSLALPDLEEASFSALKQCADSFPVELTFSGKSATFLAAILYSLRRGRVSIQRIGMDVAASVTTCLETHSNTQDSYTPTCHQFLLTLLRGLASGGVYFANTRQLARSILPVARGMPQGLIGECFETVSTETPKSRQVLETVYAALMAALQSTSGDPSAAAVRLEDVLRNSLSSLRGVGLL